MNYLIHELNIIVAGEAHFNSSAEIKEIVIDTRSFFHANNSLFVALSGAKRDGHNFIDLAYKKGIRNFLVESLPTTIYESTNFIVVPNCLNALQAIAKHHRKQYSLSVIGITGSHGKTVVKEWLGQLLSPHRNLVKSPKSYNSQIGVPLSVLGIDFSHEIGLFEAGISEPKEMDLLEHIICPNIGVLTNITDAHIQNFKNQEELIEEKIKLFYNCEVIVANISNQLILNTLRSKLPKTKIISWGGEGDNSIIVVKKEPLTNDSCTNLIFNYNNKEYPVCINFSDNASIENTCTVFATLIALELPLVDFLPNFIKLTPIEMRLELTEGINNCLIINDGYHSDLHSIKVALEVLNHQKKTNKTLILSSLSDLDASQEAYQNIANWINEAKINKVILIGDLIIKHKKNFHSIHTSFASTESFLHDFRKEMFYNEVILIKGAFSFNFNKIATALTLKKHDTLVEINLHALINNLNTFKSFLKPQTKIMCMVKAFSYGTGSYEVAQALEFNGVDYLGVAYADEGVLLRNSGISLPIMVLNPEQSSYDSIIKNNLEPEIYSFRVLNKFIDALEKNNISFAYPIHIKIDTGMNRLGFKANEIESLKIKLLNHQTKLTVLSVFSHLAESENINDSSFSLKQLDLFDELFTNLTSKIKNKPFRHILNSTGILNFPNHQYEMVRLGIGLYGFESNEKVLLENVANFKTVISQIKTIEKGESVSYNRRFIASKPTKIAILPIGYADGIHRIAGNSKGFVSINNQKAMIIGSICMDTLMVDVTNINCEEGDAVCIFGNNPSLKEVANFCDTIPYEILTSISHRVKRIYYKE